MGNAVLKIPIRTLNRNKAARLEAMQAEFTGCVRFHLERVEATGTTNATALHRDCYHEAGGRFRLPASTVPQARDKAIQARKSHVNRRKHDRRAGAADVPPAAAAATRRREPEGVRRSRAGWPA